MRAGLSRAGRGDPRSSSQCPLAVRTRAQGLRTGRFPWCTPAIRTPQRCWLCHGAPERGFLAVFSLPIDIDIDADIDVDGVLDTDIYVLGCSLLVRLELGV